MTVIEGVDYAFSHPSISALTAAKKRFAVRYIGSKDYTKSRSSKWLSPVEYKALKAAGIAVVVVFETGAQRAEAGRAAGVADAKIAVTELKYCGLPSGTVVYFAVDYPTTVGPHITGYLQGVASVIGKGRTGVYGGYAVVKGCFDDKLVTFGWQTYAWSNGKWDKRAQLQQYANGKTLGGATVDYTRVTTAKYGQAAPPSTPAPSKGGTVSSAPSWPAVYALIMKQKAKWARGRTGPNVNDYTRWYPMNGAPFCFMFVSWILAHAGSSEAAGLALIGGRKAYVPHIRNIKGYRAGHSGMKVGAIVAVSGFNHIGFCTAINGSEFTLYSGNTTYAGSDDAVWPKTYSLSSVSGYVNPAYGSSNAGTTEDNDDMGAYVSIDKATTGKGASRVESLVPGEWHQVYFNRNNSQAATVHHAKGDFPSFVMGGHYYGSGAVSLTISGLPKGVEGQVRCLYVDAKGTVKDTAFISEFVGSTGDTFVTHPAAGYVPAGLKCRVEVKTMHAADAQPKVTGGQVRIFVK